MVCDGELALKNALDKFWREYCSDHAYYIVHEHSMTVSPKDFASLPPCNENIKNIVENVVENLKKIRGTKGGKKAIESKNQTFPQQYTLLNCASFVHDNFLKVKMLS